ncbi:MAG TPA: hypothetical protein EYH00_00850 [Archaeoglobus profundus]|nr:hypothetical protein [Archaeoglobus profundus]
MNLQLCPAIVDWLEKNSIFNDELKHVKIVAEIIRLVASGKIESIVELIKKDHINFILVDLINHKK